jgi:hypothetical protein
VPRGAFVEVLVVSTPALALRRRAECHMAPWAFRHALRGAFVEVLVVSTPALALRRRAECHMAPWAFRHAPRGRP